MLRRLAGDTSVDDANARAGVRGEHIDRCATFKEVGHHLRGDLGRVRRDTARSDAVVTGGDDHQPPIEVRARLAGHRGDTFRHRFQPTNRAGRLGELRLPRRRLRARLQVMWLDCCDGACDHGCVVVGQFGRRGVCRH